MKKTLRLDAEAEEEIDHAIDRYDNEREGLGAEFFAELSDAMDTLAAPGPECGLVIGLPAELGVRRKLLSRFPYAIVFVEGDAFVRVISVMHGHRRPAYWRRRICGLAAPRALERARSISAPYFTRIRVTRARDAR
jgi:toxin ParE1/3/4